jgi:hypothetical protein
MGEKFTQYMLKTFERKVADKRGRVYEVDVTIDLEKIAELVATRATATRRGKATALMGAVVAKIKPIKPLGIAKHK